MGEGRRDKDGKRKERPGKEVTPNLRRFFVQPTGGISQSEVNTQSVRGLYSRALFRSEKLTSTWQLVEAPGEEKVPAEEKASAEEKALYVLEQNGRKQEKSLWNGSGQERMAMN